MRKLEDAISVLVMAMLVVITLLNVVTRYLTSESYAWTEELSVFLMIVLTLAGAASAAASDRHIRIEFFYDGGSARRKRQLRLLSAGVTCVFFVLMTVLFALVLWDEVRYAETSMGLGIPRWWYTAWIPPLCGVIALRAGWLALAIARNAVPPEPPADTGAAAPKDPR